MPRPPYTRCSRNVEGWIIWLSTPNKLDCHVLRPRAAVPYTTSADDHSPQCHKTTRCVALSALYWAAVFVQLEVEWPRALNQVLIPFSYPNYGFDGAGFKGTGRVDTGRASRHDLIASLILSTGMTSAKPEFSSNVTRACPVCGLIAISV